MSCIVIYSSVISNEIIEQYSYCISFMSDNTIGNSKILGI